MKKITLFLVLAILTFACAKAFADPPDSIDADYDIKRNVLVIEVNHPVLDPTEHYINSVTVYQNSKLIFKKDFEQQTDREGLNVPPIDANANAGDVFKITATCNKGGSKTTSLTVKNKELY